MSSEPAPPSPKPASTLAPDSTTAAPEPSSLTTSHPNSSPSSSPGRPRSGSSARRALSVAPAPSPPLNAGPAPVGPSSPSGGNRFGLALGFIQRRPRGLSSAGGGGRSPGAGSPGSELPPSPSGGQRSGYGFPALRRTISKRTESPAPTTASNNGDSRRNHSRAGSGGSPSATTSNLLDSPRPSTSNGPPAATANPPTEIGPLTSTESFKLRLVPHLESSRSLHFEPIDRDLNALNVLRVGRFTDRSSSGAHPDPLRVAFKSKVVSRGHAEVWCDEQGKFFIKDTKSSSGTFLNHIRLSAPGAESRAFPLKDGDVLQLGVDYQGGTEEIYRCVKMRVELNRSWQRGMNSFNTAALAQLRALGGAGASPSPAESNPAAAAATTTPTLGGKPAQKAAAATASVTDCCICLYPVTVCQALFIAPCSHVTHFKCIRPLVQQNYPGFSCPLCRTYSDLEADVEIEPFEEEVPAAGSGDDEVGSGSDQPMASVVEQDEPRDSRAPSVRLLEESSRRSSLAHIGADVLPLGMTPASRAGSIRAGSVRAVEAATTPDEALASPATPPSTGAHPIGMAMATPVRATDSETEAWLASAATPPNNTFLSTLADSGVASLPHSRYQAPVSLGMAINGLGSGEE